MSTMPPEEPATPPPPPPAQPTVTQGSYGGLGGRATTGAILPVPGNAEFALYVVVVIFLIVIWAATDAVDSSGFSTWLTVLTSFYFVSRGIAKASRVLEQ
jgi:hypothetical protein